MRVRMLLPLVLPAAAGAAQPPDPSGWTPANDALVAAPANHKVLLENDRVRVLEVTVPPRTREPVHAHRWPSVVHVTEGGHFIDRDGSGTVTFDSRTLPTPPKLPVVGYRPFEAPHAIENLDPRITMRLIRVEIKPQQ